ncbi:MAG: DegQ family serine endoprotease [Burkholderiales bacterium]|nr:DegQ family serine endoprotease [Burkholderiales bacterium]
MRTRLLAGILIAAGVVAAGVGAYWKFHPSLSSSVAAATAPARTTSAGARAAAASTLPDFTSIVARNGPAVVNISVTGKSPRAQFNSGGQGIDPNDPFYWFFRQFRMPQPRGGVPLQGVGSGFIVSPDGVVLTNAHVVADATDVTVKLTDQREFKARVAGIDRPSDVAVLKIDAKNLPSLTLDPADDVKVGEWVVAIGSPYGFENSVTAGIVSAKSRALDGTYVPFLQTDVAVNPGNSGGPLFNLKGEVVGINSQIYSRSGGYQGLSFAIPIGVALNVEKQLLEHGRVTRGWLGVTIQDVNQGLADSFGLKKPAGALVSSVQQGSPAARAGIETGDVIVSYGGKAITNSRDLPVLVADTAPGTRTGLDVVRKGQAKRVEVTVGTLKNAKVASAEAEGKEHEPLGLVVRPLEQDERAQAGVTAGVVVEDVTGPAARAGIEPGDVILSLNNSPVTSPAQLRELAQKAGKHVALLVQREDTRIFVPVDHG